MPTAEDIEVNISDAPTGADGMTGKTAVVIDRKANRAWSGGGKTESEAATKAIRNFIGGRHIREYIG